MAGDEKVGLLASDIEQLTKRGAGYLLMGDLNGAKQAFEQAFRKAQHLRDGFTERACAFNLGAVYIASRLPKDGLEMLQRAVPPMNQRDGKSNGDLFYNFGLGYEAMNNENEAVKYFELALEEYQFERENFKMEAEVSSKIGIIYVNLQCPLQAARSYGIAALAHSRLQQAEQQATNFCKQVSCLLRAGKEDDAIQIADNCVVLCQNVEEGELLGRLYNELGLIYSQARDFPKAATCFELALPLSRGPHGDIRRQAVILQNLGAIYNSLSDYQRALPFHEQATDMFAKLNNRNSQGQCFTNLAFAHSQLGNTENATECYLHAYQAAKDSGDKKGQWQALEGLGAGAFNDNNIDKAVKYFKQALATLSESGENNPKAQERVVAKLTDALQCQIKKENKGSYGETANPLTEQEPVDILVNDLPRPPTAQEIMQLRRIQNTKIANEFDTIALGIGGYETDSDRSLSRHPKRRMSQRSRSHGRPKSAARDYVDRNVQSDSEDRPKPANRKSFSRRQSELEKISAHNPSAQRRGHTRPLLRSTDFDSEEEFREMSRRKRDGSVSGSDVSYQERLRPPSTDEEEDNRYKKVKKRPKKKHFEEVLALLRGKPQKDDIELGDTATLEEYEKHVERRAAGSDSETVTDSESDTLTGADTSRSFKNTALPTQSPPPPPLVATYENPVDPSKTYQNEPANDSSPSTPETHGANYFRETRGRESTLGTEASRDQEFHTKDVPLLPEWSKTVLAETNSEVKKETVPDEDDPLYSTIRTMRKPDEEAGPSRRSTGPPTLPPPRDTPVEFSKMTTGEQELYLYRYQQQMDENKRLREMEEASTDVKLPRKGQKQTSAMCLIM